LAKKPDFDQNDTIKGMLFKLRHGRFELPKYSLLVVDEAGMIGNEDYHELMRVAATRKCNVILAGDERQLTSVQRGGMFEVFAGSYGSTTLLDIQRQKSDWGKDVAMAFSRGEVVTGVGILQAQNRLLVAKNANESMQSLLADWSKSQEKVADRLIIAVKNKDVDALNHGARQYLKLEGVLSGEEIAVGGHHYMQGDRILIKQTNKELGLTNGDLAQLVRASKDQFVLRLENGNQTKEIAFDPSKYSSFRHGYATTVFKSQAASILDVFVFHDGFAGLRNSYVALSRHVNQLKLYINNQATVSTAHLIKQLGHDPEIGSSLSYLTKADLDTKELNEGFQKSKGFVSGFIVGALDFASRKITELSDKHLPATEYYQYKVPQVQPERIEAVLDSIGMGYEEVETMVHAKEKIAVGGNIVAANNIIQAKIEENNHSSSHNLDHSLNVDTILNVNKSSQSAKQRFYAQADFARNAARNVAKTMEQKAVWDNESEQLRHAVRFKTEQIARDLLGEPNKKISDGRTLRFGEHGKIAVRISGERMGTWYDFSSSTGGDIFALVQEKQACDFKAAAEYLRREYGMQSGNLSLVHDHKNSDLIKKYIKERQAEERAAKAKQVLVNNLHNRAKDIGDRSVAHRYLTQKRGITCGVGIDIKTTGVYSQDNQTTKDELRQSTERNQGEYLPAIVAFARNEQGIITGGQQILLDKRTGGKAEVDIAKRSFGKIAGSFVEVGKGQNNLNAKSNLTVIAEGLETALSVKQALANDPNNKDIQVKVLCSLGISNIKNYQPAAGEKIIIAADNDGEHAITMKSIDTAKKELANKGAFVEIARPDRVGDFNDLLQQEGEEAITKSFTKVLAKHTTTSLNQYFANDTQSHMLSQQEKADIVYIQKFNINEEKLTDAYRASSAKGRAALEDTRKSLGFVEHFLQENKRIVEEAKAYGAKIDDHKLVLALVGKSPKEMERSITSIRDKYYISDHLEEFKLSQASAKTPAEVVQNMHLEQRFLSGFHGNLKYPEDHSPELLNSIKAAHKNDQENTIGQLSKLITFLEKNANTESTMKILKESNSPVVAHKNLIAEYHAKSVEKIHTGLSLLDKGQSFTLDNKHFDCPIKFLDHLAKTHTGEYFPKAELQKIQSKVIENHHKQLGLSKELDGPDL
jgi:hypothetical protein